MTADKRYVYGVIEAESLAFPVDGVAGADRVRSVEHRDLSAVVSDVEDLDVERSEENLRRHDDVLQDVMVRGDGRTVVPMQFGMVFEHERALENVLENGSRAFERALRETQGMVELGVKVVGPADGGADRGEVAASVTERLTSESEAVAENDAFSDRILVNRSFLVERDDRGAFDAAIDDVRAAHDAVTVQYTGPWPPYSFVDIQVGVEQ